MAAKNALSSLLAQQHEQTNYMVAPVTATDNPFPTMEFNRGVVVDVDFTSDDPADANFIINTMNRMQPPPPPPSSTMIQMPLQETGVGGGGPLTALPANGHVINSNGAGTGKTKTPLSQLGNETDQLLCSMEVDKQEKEEEDKENQNDSGHVDPDDEEMEEEEVEEDEEDSDSEYENIKDEDRVATVKVYMDVREIIRISVDHYIDYEEDVQCKYNKQKQYFNQSNPDFGRILFSDCCNIIECSGLWISVWHGIEVMVEN